MTDSQAAASTWVRQGEETVHWYDEEVTAIERNRLAAPPPTGGVVFYGSSSIRLWESLADDFPGCGVVNAGFGGSTLAACSWFFTRLVVPLQPRSLVVYAGDNDLGDGQSPHDVLASYRHLIDQVDALLGPIRFGFIAIKPSPARWAILDRIRTTNELIRTEVSKRPQAEYVDVFPSMLNAAGQPRVELYAEDGLHLSAAGYRVWRQVVAEHASLFI